MCAYIRFTVISNITYLKDIVEVFPKEMIYFFIREINITG